MRWCSLQAIIISQEQLILSLEVTYTSKNKGFPITREPFVVGLFQRGWGDGWMNAASEPRRWRQAAAPVVMQRIPMTPRESETRTGLLTFLLCKCVEPKVLANFARLFRRAAE